MIVFVDSFCGGVGVCGFNVGGFPKEQEQESWKEQHRSRSNK